MSNVREHDNTRLRRFVRRLGVVKTYLRDNNIGEEEKVYRQMYTVRYADAFLIGLSCQKVEAHLIRDLISNFLKSELHLNVKKVELAYTLSNKTPFLGFMLSLESKKSKYNIYSQEKNAISKIRHRIKVRTDHFYAKYYDYLGKVLQLQ